MNLSLLYGGKGGEGHGGSVSNYANFNGSLLFYGYVGEGGINRETGGGGGGGLRLGINTTYRTNWGPYGGSGSFGTSYSGGSGGGMSLTGENRSFVYQGGNAQGDGGAGGLVRYSTGNTVISNSFGNPSDGTGGLLIIGANQVSGNGNFSSLGCCNWVPSGGSGCGSVNVFYKDESRFLGKFNVKIETISDMQAGYREYSTASGTRITSGAGTYNIGSIKTGVYISD